MFCDDDELEKLVRKICNEAGDRLCSEAQDTDCVRTDDRFTACHPDTVITTLVNLERAQTVLG